MIAAAAAIAIAPAARADGSFASSDDQLTRIWAASVRTADDTLSPPVSLDPRDCNVGLPVVILDSPIRDRCPYIGDIAVTGLTLLVSSSDSAALRAMVQWFASVQNPDGSIPDGPIYNHTEVLVDYNAYWVEALYDYTLYTGDLSLLDGVMPNLVRLMDVLYPAHVDGSGILADWIGAHDYAFIVRTGSKVAYYDAQYIRALRQASTLATWAGDAAHASSWLARAQAATAAFAPSFWDPGAGAFGDTTADLTVHPLDGNVFAVLSGAASPQQEQSALAFVDAHLARAEGDAAVDAPSWNLAHWGGDATNRIYPFIGYFDLLARYAAGADDSALALIRREWGFMLDHGPGTMWETIDASTGEPTGLASSHDHGWSSGAAPVLTGYVLGVLPTSPGFAAFTVNPHPSGVQGAEGDVPTPYGDVHVFWQLAGGTPQVSVTAPAGTTWSNAPAGPVDTVRPVVSGAFQAGSELSASTGTWAGAGPIAYGYQWSRCDAAGFACVPIAGETGASYVVQPGDADGTLRAFVTGTNAAGSSSAVTAAAGAPPPESGGGGGGTGGGGSSAVAPAPAAAPAAPAFVPPPAPVLPPPPPPPAPAPSRRAAAGTYRLVVKVAGAGKVTPSTGGYRHGARLVLRAHAAKGWGFAGWGGRWCRGTRTTCRLTLSRGKVVTARFARLRSAAGDSTVRAARARIAEALAGLVGLLPRA